MIVLAHVGAPNIFFQIRNFDVPLMVIVSGMSFGLAFKGEPFVQYLWKRIKRLIFPVWIFLTIFFVSVYLFKPSKDYLNWEIIFTSYFFISGIGYVWIIRVFVLVALVAPFIYSQSNKTKNDVLFLTQLLFIYVIYEICRYILLPYTYDGLGRYLSLIFFYLVPYSILFAFGLTLPKLKMKCNIQLLLYFSLCFISLALYLWITTGSFVSTQNYKYPPSIYYFSYAIAISIFLWLVGDSLLVTIEKYKRLNRIIIFVAHNSIWIYLWHIPLVKIIHLNFFFNYLLVFSIALMITFMQVSLVTNILIPALPNDKMKKNAKMILTG